jgi:hypothetical protein
MKKLGYLVVVSHSNEAIQACTTILHTQRDGRATRLDQDVEKRLIVNKRAL